MCRSELARVDFGSQFFPTRHRRLMIVAEFLCTVVWLAMGSSAHAQVVIFDGFNDGDRNNDGTVDGSGLTTSPDTTDIRWFRVNPKFFGSVDNPRFLIIDDSVTGGNPNGIGTGNALVIDQTELSSADWAGFFPDTITLGPNVGDKLVVSFDHRNIDLGNPDSLQGSQFTTLRFGLWQDSDNQLGTPTTDGDGVAATWGEDDGHFGRCANTAIGTCGDYGIWGRVQSAAVPSAGPSPPPLDANDFSIVEEFNQTNPAVPGDLGISMGGNDTETVAQPDAARLGDHNRDGTVDAADYVAWRKDPANNGGDPGGYDAFRANFGDANAFFSDIPIVLSSPRTLSLTLERVAPDATGQDVRVEVAVDGIGFGAQDYFMLTHNTPMDFYVIDNFKVELIAAPGGGSAAVPEPASLQLAILLLLGALIAYRRGH
jgi:hypothetical protein